LTDRRKIYTTQLGAGLGLVEETKVLLSIYEPGMTVVQLYDLALSSGRFPMVSARRLRNIIAECFAPRYLKTDVAVQLKALAETTPSIVLNQFFLIFTSLANIVLLDFIIEVYWGRYASGRDTISLDDAKDFISHAVNEGKTKTHWSDAMMKRVSSYLIGACADYGLVSPNRSSVRQIKSIRLHEHTLFFFSYWLHFNGLGDNRIVNHEIWKLFGLEAIDVREELIRIAKQGWLIVQAAGDVTRISWKYENIEEVIDVITEG
jgi:hypothetical protein